MFKLSIPFYYVLCRVFCLLFPLRMAVLLHRTLALTGTSHEAIKAHLRSRPFFTFCDVVSIEGVHRFSSNIGATTKSEVP
jgi:hypothetical protein